MTDQSLSQRSQKSPGLALVLSLVWSGVGQIYNGQVGKGIFLMVLYVISALMIFIVIGFITTPILWIYGMVDAYRTAERFNQDLVGPQKRCPYCSELIQAGALVCRFCGHQLDEASAMTGGTTVLGREQAGQMAVEAEDPPTAAAHERAGSPLAAEPAALPAEGMPTAAAQRAQPVARFCMSCGKPLSDGARFCMFCGKQN